MKANKAAPTGEWKEESTVFVDVKPMVLAGASVRAYDCAGQVTDFSRGEGFDLKVALFLRSHNCDKSVLGCLNSL